MSPRFEFKWRLHKIVRIYIYKDCGHRILAMMCFPFKDETRFYIFEKLFGKLF